MLAARLPGILPPLSATEVLETSMIHSLAGLLSAGGISKSRPFREPHHTASKATIIGDGRNAKPGEVSLVHNGVLFMDKFHEFPRTVLKMLRQPIETGEVMIARANAHVKYPCKFMLIAGQSLQIRAPERCIAGLWAGTKLCAKELFQPARCNRRGTATRQTCAAMPKARHCQS